MNEADERSVRLEEAIERWGNAVYRLALCRTGNAHDAEDIAQMVFLGFYEKFEDADNQDHAKAWLLRSTVNRCKNLRKSSWTSKVVRMPNDKIAAFHAEADEPNVAPRPESSPLSAALCALSEKQRTAIHLFYGEGYRTDEIAAITGERPSTVRSHLRRAREKLKKTLGDEYDWA